MVTSDAGHARGKMIPPVSKKRKNLVARKLEVFSAQGMDIKSQVDQFSVMAILTSPATLELYGYSVKLTGHAVLESYVIGRPRLLVAEQELILIGYIYPLRNSC